MSLIGTKRRRLKTNPESGQGVLEYILVLVIILVVILGLVYQFNAKFRLYAEQFFDGYIACLLETGELPGVGGSSCEEEIKTIADMQAKGLLRFPDDGSGGGGGEGGGNKDKSSDNGKAADTSSRERGETVSNGGGGGGRTTNFGNFGRGGGRDRSTPVRTGANSKEEADAMGYGGLSMPSGYYSGDMASARRDRVTYVYDEYSEVDERVQGKPPVAKTDKKAENSNALRPKRAIENTTRRSTASIDINEAEFSFGEMIRWLIIAALILAIIIFFGGQLLQIMRSREKGGVD